MEDGYRVDGYRVEILKSPDRFGDMIRIGCIDRGILYVAKPVKLIFEAHRQGECVPATIELLSDGDKLLDALKSALNDHYGIREGHAEGELKATKEHLKDLKTILFDQMGIVGIKQ